MYKIIIICFIVLLTYALTNYSLKGKKLGACTSEYYNSNSSEDRNKTLKDADEKSKIKEKCILCHGKDDISNTRKLNGILDRLGDYYYNI
tara:strand:+ start:17 stop:286 length:270 start_codon:yes stop_codon:yes gene_type:complete